MIKHETPNPEIQIIKDGLKCTKTRLGNEMKREEEKLKRRYASDLTAIHQRYTTKEIDAEKDTHRRYAGIVLNQLERNRELIAERSGLVEVLDEHFTGAKTALGIVEMIPAEKREIVLNNMLDLTKPREKEHILSAIKILQGQSTDPAMVTSFLGYTQKDREYSFFLFTPIPSEPDKNQLARILEDKMESICETGELLVGTNPTIAKCGTVESIKTNKIDFVHDTESIHGFHTYRIETGEISPSYIQNFMNAFKKKIEQLSPDELKKAKLTHKVDLIDEPRVVDMLRSRKRTEIYSPKEKLDELIIIGEKYIPPAKASEITGRSIQAIKIWAKDHQYTNEREEISIVALRDFRGVGGYRTPLNRKYLQQDPQSTSFEKRNSFPLNHGTTYQSATREGILEEAKSRLNSMPDRELSPTEFSKILGYLEPTSIHATLKKLKNDDPESRRDIRKRGHRTFIPKTIVEKFLGSYEMTYRGWKRIE